MSFRTNDWQAERAEALAIVRLTRRRDLEWERLTRTVDGAVGLVHLLDEGKRTGRCFLLRVASADSLSRSDADRLAAKLARRQADDGSRPTALLVFSMDDDAGYFAWLTPPTGERRAESPDRRKASTRPLDACLLDEAVRAVRRWSDAVPNALVS